MNILTSVSNILIGTKNITTKNMIRNSSSTPSTYKTPSSVPELSNVSSMFVGVFLLIAMIANAILTVVGVIVAIISIVMNVKKHNNKRTIWSIVLLVLSAIGIPEMIFVEALAGNTSVNSMFGIVLLVIAFLTHKR